MNSDLHAEIEAFLVESIMLELGAIRRALAEAAKAWPAALEPTTAQTDRILARLGALEDEARRLCARAGDGAATGPAPASASHEPSHEPSRDPGLDPGLDPGPALFRSERAGLATPAAPEDIEARVLARLSGEEAEAKLPPLILRPPR